VGYGSNRQHLIALILALSLIRGVIYAAIVPPWQAPDEPKHYEYIRLLYENRRLVTQKDTSLPLQREIIASMREHRFWEFGYSKVPESAADSFEAMWWPANTLLDRPPLYYILCAPFYGIVAHQPITIQVYALRIVSVVLNILIIAVAFFTTRELFPDDALLSAGIATFIVFLPMFSQMAGSLNSDSLASLIASAVIWFLIAGLRRGFSAWRILGLVLLLFLGLVTKRTTVFTIPLALVAMVMALYRTRRSLNWKSLGFVVGGILGVGGLIGWLWIARGEQMQWVLDHYFADSSFEWYVDTLFRTEYFSREFASGLWLSFQAIFRSFWGGFGWLTVDLSLMWYQGIALANLVALVGFVVYTIRVMNSSRALAKWQKQGLLILLVGLVGNLALLIGKGMFEYWSRAQGRYLFPAIIPIAVLFTLGMREIIPSRHHKAWLVSYIAILLLYDSVALTRYIIPFFYR